MALAFHSETMAKVLIVGGLCGIVTSWNSFLIGGSRAMYSMAESYMIPKCFGKVHPKYKTPINSLLVIGGLSMISPFFGRQMLVWLANAGNFGCCVAYCMVALSFLVLRYKEPQMTRPYRVKSFRLVGGIATISTCAMVMMYIVPNSGATLIISEWIIVGSWIILGGCFYIACKIRYKEKFASHIDVENEELINCCEK